MFEIQVRFSRFPLNHYTVVVQRLPNVLVKIHANFQDDSENNQLCVQRVGSLLYKGALPQEGIFGLVYKDHRIGSHSVLMGFLCIW